MHDAFHAEFTGERVIPGRVEDNLFNEHLARYRFSARLVLQLGVGGAFLDAGCGAGYGTAELAKSGAQVLGIDVSADAVAHARANYATTSNVRFEKASCTAIPAEDDAFRLITAFEVIEHLEDWRGFLEDARRVLDPAGLFLVSTPNRLYYAESRQKAGPNPFHVHEFTEEEFRAELASVFPHVKILLQNHVEGIAFSGTDAESAALEIAERADDPSDAHFFLAVCGKQPLPPITRFVFIPETGNVLQTRERHIALLDGEIRQKNQWIEAEKAAHSRMEEKVQSLEAEMDEHTRWAHRANEEAERQARLVAGLQDELRKSNEWAKSRDAEAVERGQRVEQLQAELAQATDWARNRDAEVEERGQRITQLQTELEEATDWAKRRDAEAVRFGERIVQLQDELAATHAGYQAAIEQWRRDKAESDLQLNESREALGLRLAEVDQLRARMDTIAQSRWVRLGRSFRVGPEIDRN